MNLKVRSLGFPRSSHWQRFLTASLLIPALFAYLFWGGPVLFLLLTWAGLLAGTYEVLKLIRSGAVWPFFLFPAGTASLTLGLTAFFGLEGLLGGLVLSFLAWAISQVWVYRTPDSFFDGAGRMLISFLYLPLFMSFFVLIRWQPRGLPWIFFLLAVNYAGDTAAYYIGRTWGRHKLAPAVSPKKTIEGSLGGLAANGLMAGIFQLTLFPEIGAGKLLALGILLGGLSQFGDLTESLLKRAAGFKDSGVLFPGHGGFLDRVDSLLFPAPVLFFFIHQRFFTP